MKKYVVFFVWFYISCNSIYNFSSLEVITIPQGASIYIDGENTGKYSNYTFRNIENGEHHIKLVRNGYEAVDTTITIEGKITLKINLVKSRWSRIYEDSLTILPNDIKPFEENSCYIIAAERYYPNKIMLIKIDANGNEEWVKEIEGEFFFNSKAPSIYRYNSSTFLIIALSSQYYLKPVILTMSFLGNLISERIIDEEYYSIDYFNILEDGTLGILGKREYSSPPTLAFYDTKGSRLKTFTVSLEEIKGTRHPVSFEKTPDQGYIILEKLHKDDDDNDIMITKINEYGGVEWHKTFDYEDEDEPVKILVTDDGEYIVLATISSFSSSNIVLFKMDKNGNIKWEKKFGEVGVSIGAISLISAQDGGYIIGCRNDKSFYYGDEHLWLIKLDEDGNIVWDRIYADIPFLCRIRKALFDGYIILSSLYLDNKKPILVVKTDKYGYGVVEIGDE